MDFQIQSNRVWLENEQGDCLAEINFPDTSEDTVNINHTFVDPSLRGQGVADQLMHAAAAHIRKDKKKAYPTCSYAIKWFEQHPEQTDICISKSDD